jgi:hypothetical protein
MTTTKRWDNHYRSMLHSAQRNLRFHDCQWYRTRLIIYGFAALALLLAGASGAGALDEKVFPGAMCVQTTPGLEFGQTEEVETTSTVRYTNAGEAFNVSPTDRIEVVCPIVRDTVTESFENVAVVVRDRNEETNPFCTANVLSADGQAIHVVEPVNPIPVTGPFISESYTLRIPFFNSPTPSFDLSRGSYFLRCVIPPWPEPEPGQQRRAPSGVVSYRIVEPD